jgi:hypothetical protein
MQDRLINHQLSWMVELNEARAAAAAAAAEAPDATPARAKAGRKADQMSGTPNSETRTGSPRNNPHKPRKCQGDGEQGTMEMGTPDAAAG